jgi:23S rRNA-/tRNA-specific pseudouridylate synthase
MKVAPGGEGLTAITKFSTVETKGGEGVELTLLKLEPVTGRTHQLRVQCAWHRHPIVGDGTYGDFAFNRAFAKSTGEKRLFLHAAAVRLPGLDFAAESPLPEEFRAALR